MSCYHHLTIEEREKLYLFENQGMSVRQIALLLHRSPSTISRELKRNAGLLPCQAQRAYQKRRRNCVRKSILSDRELCDQVRFLLGHLFWSPEQIANRLKYEQGHRVSTSTIYRALDRGLLRDTLRVYLRIKYKKIGQASKRNKACFRRSISERPQEANERTRIGDFEADTIVGSKGPAAIVTATDRRSRFLLAGKVEQMDATTVREKLVSMLKSTGKKIETVTLDQGSEFVQSQQMEQDLGVSVYFAHPHSPWEKPTVENTNGLLRQFVPKRHSLNDVSEADLSTFCALLNLRPRKCLGWLTPYEAFFFHVLHFT